MLVAVPCAEADAVALLDAADGDEVGRIGVGDHPVHLAAAGGRVLVATMGERAISAVTDGVVERVPTGVLGPSHFAVADGRAFVPCTGGDAVAVVDVAALERLDRVAVGAEPHDADVVGDAVYVGSRADGTVTVLDTDTAAVRATVDTAADSDTAAQPRIQGLAAAEDGVYAVDQSNGRVLLVGEDGVRATAETGANPYDPVVVDGRVFVAGRDDGTVTELPPDLSGATTHRVGGRPTAVVAAAGGVWVFNRANATAWSLDGGRLSLSHPGFAAVRHPERAHRVFVAHYDDDAVSAVDLDAGTVAWTATTPRRPFEPLVV